MIDWHSSRLDVTCVGIIVADVFVRPVRGLPEPGGLHLVDELTIRGGGGALSTATLLARLGLSVELVGKVGKDPFGDYLVHLMDGRNVSHRHLVRDTSTPTSASVVLVARNGERSFLHLPGANGSLQLSEIDMDLVRSGRALHVAGALVMPGLDGEPMARLMAAGRKWGLYTSLDTVWDDSGNWQRINASLPYLDLFAPSLAEARAVTGLQDVPEIAAKLRGEGTREVVVKLGAAGCYVAADDFEGYIPSTHVDSVDATGAGDAFMAALLYGRLAGWPLERSARLANAAGALAITALGATEALLEIKSVHDLEQWQVTNEETPQAPIG